MGLFLKIFKYFPFSWKCRIVDFLLKSQGIVIKQAETQEELEKVFRLRYEVYKEADYIDPSDYPDQRLTDKYEKYSVSFLALKNGEAVGTVRLIHDTGVGFSTERAFNILSLPDDFFRPKVVELSKLCLRKKYRKGLISVGLLKKALEYSKKAGLKYWIFETTTKLANYFGEIAGVLPILLPTGRVGLEQTRERNIVAKRYFERFKLRPYILKID